MSLSDEVSQFNITALKLMGNSRFRASRFELIQPIIDSVLEISSSSAYDQNLSKECFKAHHCHLTLVLKVRVSVPFSLTVRMLNANSKILF